MDAALKHAISEVPAGAWGVGVSGGADSVALLSLLRERADLKLHVLHVDHETRGSESAQDAGFVIELMNRWQLNGSVVRRSAMENAMKHLPTNRSARFRAVRLRFFRREVDAHGLMGVILAHHAGDQAETVFQRLLRGSRYSGLVGMSRCASVAGVKILRPLLEVRRSALREHLRAIGQDWREDASNASNDYQRNRVRRMLEQCEMLPAPLIELSKACRKLRDWARSSAPVLAEQFPVTALQDLPELLADESARRWLVQRGVPREEIVREVVARLMEMVNDAASAPRRDFPGDVHVVRKARVISSSGPESDAKC